jgi:uncharacterized membrane protein YedE/YeeE
MKKVLFFFWVAVVGLILFSVIVVMGVVTSALSVAKWVLKLIFANKLSIRFYNFIALGQAIMFCNAVLSSLAKNLGQLSGKKAKTTISDEYRKINLN